MDIKFDFENGKHECILDGIKLPSCTQILAKIGIAKDVSKVKNIEQYAEMGTKIHKAIEDYINNQEVNEYLPHSVINAIDGYSALGYELIPERNLISKTLGYFGRADLILTKEKEKKFIVIDFKSGKCDKAAVSAQMSMYAYAFIEEMREEKDEEWTCIGTICISELRAVVNNEKDEDETDKFDYEGSKKVELYLKCYNNNEIYVNFLGNLLCKDNGIKKFNDVMLKIAELDKEKKELEKSTEIIKAKLLENMKKYDIKTFESDSVRFTYIPSTTREVIDKAKLEKDGLYDKYLKVSPVKDSLRITIKDKE